MDLYTFILDFRGGTYVSQYNGRTLNETIEIWAKNLDISKIQYFGKASKEALISYLPKMFQCDEVYKIDSIKSVYSFNCQLKTGLLIAHIVKTA